MKIYHWFYILFLIGCLTLGWNSRNFLLAALSFLLIVGGLKGEEYYKNIPK